MKQYKTRTAAITSAVDTSQFLISNRGLEILTDFQKMLNDDQALRKNWSKKKFLCKKSRDTLVFKGGRHNILRG
jgi:hypothetical protein